MKNIFPHCKLFWSDQDNNLLLSLVFDKFGMHGQIQADGFWSAIRKTSKKEHVITDSCVSIDGIF